MTSPVARPHHWLVPATIAAALWVSASAGPSGQASASPQELYTRAQAKEKAAREGDEPSVATLRSLAAAYELVFREYPASGYADDAVWMSAKMWAEAAASSGRASDARKAERWLKWLRQEYPDSSYTRKVDAALDALARPPAPQPQPSAPPLPPVTSPAASVVSAPANAPAPKTAGPAQVRSITATPLPQGQRITIELSQEVAYTSERVDSPDRVYFDFSGTAISASVIERAQAAAGGLIKTTRFGHPSAGTTRVVFDLTGKPRFSAFTVYEPFRVQIDLIDPTLPARPEPSRVEPTTAEPPKADPPRADPPRAELPKSEGPKAPPAATPPASQTHQGGYTLGRQLGLGVSRIVIDAGHGGHDPGAMANGVTEAELVLDVARRLEKLLASQPGFQVVLTRDTDDFIALEQRTAIANREGADLFLSIHANASRDTSARGVETYVLNFATNSTAEAVAARENALSARNMGEMTDLVKAITLNNKLKESRELATFVQNSLTNNMSKQNRALKDLGVKQAPFVVLIGATMPSVLAEISFLTNKNEASLLKQPTFRQRIAQALCDAVVKYQASLKKATNVASREGGR